MSIAMLVMWIWAQSQTYHVTVDGDGSPPYTWYAADNKQFASHGKIVRTEPACVDIYEDNFNGYWPCSKSAAEPLDVPAVQETVKSKCWPAYHGYSAVWDCENGARPPKDTSPPSMVSTGEGVETIDGVGGKRWTCSGKRRVLLTDESGKRHCILFGGDK